jgi:hypothetical protein
MLQPLCCFSKAFSSAVSLQGVTVASLQLSATQRLKRILYQAFKNNPCSAKTSEKGPFRGEFSDEKGMKSPFRSQFCQLFSHPYTGKFQFLSFFAASFAAQV